MQIQAQLTEIIHMWLRRRSPENSPRRTRSTTTYDTHAVGLVQCRSPVLASQMIYCRQVSIERLSLPMVLDRLGVVVARAH